MAVVASQLQNSERYTVVPYRVLTVLSSEVRVGGLLVVLVYIKWISNIKEFWITVITFYP